MPGLINGAREAANANLDKYEQWAKENPNTKLAADLAPGVGMGTSAADAAVAARAGDYGQAAIEMLGLVPYLKQAVKAAGAVKSAVGASDAVLAASRAARLTDVANDVNQWDNNSTPLVERIEQQLMESNPKRLREFLLSVPGMREEERNHLLSGGEPTQEMVDRGATWAAWKIRNGVDPFPKKKRN